MKPYFRTIWNSIRYSLLCHLRCKNLIFKFPNLLGYNTRLVVDKTSYVYVGKKVISDAKLRKCFKNFKIPVNISAKLYLQLLIMKYKLAGLLVFCIRR